MENTPGPWDQYRTQNSDSAPPGEGPWTAYGGAQKAAAPAAPKRTLGGTARDIGVTALKGAVGLPQAAVGLLDIPTGGHAGKAIEGAGVRFKDAQDALDTMYSPAQQAANRKVQEADGFLGTAKAMLENPSTIATGIGESIPQMLGGAGAARGAMALAPKLGPVLAGALGEGLVGAGSAAEQVRGQTQDGLLTGKQAALAGASGLATAGLGALGGKVAQRLGVGDVDTMLAGGTTRAAGQGSTRSTARQVLEGAVAEGALEEMPQSMAEQALQNVALDKPIGEGVGAAAAQGLITGTAMGGAGGGIGASGNRTQQRAQEHADAQATQSAEEATASAEALTEEARQPPTMDTIAGEPINPVDRGAPATFEDLVTPQPKPEVDPYTAWDQEAAASAPQAEAPAPVRPSEAMGIDPTAGPLSKGAALAVDSGVTDQMLQAAQAVQAVKESSKKAPAAQDSQAQAAIQNVATSQAELPPPTNLREGLERIRARRQEAANAQAAAQQAPAPAGALSAARASAMESAGPAPVSTTTGVTDGPQADQAQQTAPQQPQAPAAPGLTNAATTQNDGAQGQAAPGAQGAAPAPQAAVARPDGWRKSMLRAVPVAKSLGIDHKGKRLAQVVAEIDARDTRPPAAPIPAPAPTPDPARIGRDQTPLAEGGKPFKTRKAAADAKKLQPMMRVVPVDGGYALAEKTPAQLAAEAKAARRLAQPRTGTAGAPLAAHEFIAAEGGLNAIAASDLGIDGNPRIGNRRLFAGRGRGLSMEQATQKLIADGYLGEGATLNDAYALIKTSLSRPQYNADGYERIAQAESDAQFDDYMAAQEEMAQDDDGFDGPFGLPPELTAEDLAAEGYTAANPALQAEVNALVAQAEAAGIDTYDVLEDIARNYADATQDQYNAAAREALAAAIARSNQDGGRPTAATAPAAPRSEQEQGLNQPVALEKQAQAAAESVAPEALELTALSPAQAAAQQDAQEQAAKAEAAAKRAEDAAAKAEEERKRIAQASVRAADRFELGQDPMDSLTGQGLMFSRAPGKKTGEAISTAKRDEAFSKWSNNAPLVTSAEAPSYNFKSGEKIVVEAFHGTKRPDRIGGVFDPKRATSGPMAFFTSSPELASSYSTNKIDTSLADEDQSYKNWFRYKPAGQRSEVDIARAWHFLTPDQKATIFERMPDIRTNDDGDIIYEKGGGDIGSYEWELKQTQRGYDKQGNPLNAAVETWLSSGALFNDELEFVKVLKLAGFPVQDLRTDFPTDEFPSVFKTFISMQKPLVVSDMPAEVRASLEQKAKTDRTRSQVGADNWDKRSRTLREWVDHLNGKNGADSTYAWTSIPDKVTDVLKSFGYDGIVDWSGKGGGHQHPVYIPFASTQVKGAFNRGTYDLTKKDINFSREMSPELAQSILALRRPPETATKDSVRAAVRELVNGLGLLPNRLGRVVVATSDEIKKEWEPLIGATTMDSEGAGQAQGFYDPASKTVFLIADNIKAGDELGVVAHELMHKHGPAVLGQEGWDKLHSAIGGWASAPKESMERTVYAEAARRVRKSRPADADVQGYSSQELFPYAVQVALEMGVRPNALAPQGTVARWLAQVRSALRTVWNKIASSKGDFNSLDLVNLAFGIAQRENPAHSGELDAAAVDGAARAQKALKEISDAEDLFALPKSEQSTVDGITAAHDPEIKVTTTDLGGETMYTLTMPDGTRATITSREPTKDEVFGMDESSGRWITERPGEKAPPVGSRSDVWVDVSALKPGQNGARVYNIAATYAHNTGRIFIGDPSGLSDVALRRRAEQMLSSALKFGTTDHLAPHPRQVAGDAALGVPPLRWVYGDHAGNIDRLVDVNQKALENVFSDAKNLSYDLDTGNFIDDRTGTVLTREALARSADARGRSRGESEAGAGWKTTARSAVFRALLREERSGSEGGGQGGRFLGGLVSQRAKLASSTERADERIFYSRSASSVAADDYSPAQQVAAERAFGTITKQTWAERAQSFRANLGTKLRQGLVDQFAPIKEVSQEAYMLARMSKGSDGAVEAALLYGKPFLRDGVTDVDMKDGGFAKVLASLKGEHDRFFQWVAAQRAERLKAEGRENLLTDQDISALRSLNAGKMADGTVRMPLYAKALQELNAFNEASLKVALESGLIDQAAYDLMKDQPYVPFYRLMEDGDMRGPRFSSGLVNQQAWKKLKGGTQQISADLLQNTLLNWSHLYAAAARNRASLATMAEAEKLGIAYQVPADTKGAVKVMRDGVSEHWAVEDPYLLEAIAALNYSPGGIVKALAPFKRLLTFGVTVNPTFKIRNLIRDSLSAIAQSDLSYNPAENVAKGWKATSKASQTYASMLASGGIIKFGTQENADHLRGHIERLGGTMLDKQGWEKLTGQMRSLWETYEEFGDRTENVNRAALYERLRAKGLSHAEASFQARDLMDFSMSGKWEAIRFLTQTVPFLNARMQGLYKLGRAANQDPRRFAAMAGAVSAASLALLAAYGDDDDWKKREDWDRDNYWWFKIGETAFRIPKPFEVGAIGTLAERTAELMMSEEMTGKRFGQRISDMVFNTFAMDPTPQAIKPFLDVYANKDSFSGRAIEGMADERLRPKDRYNERTSEVARLLGSWGLPDPVRLVKGEYAGLSPKQVDFLLRGYFGWLAVVTTTATDTVSRPLLDRGDRPAMRMRDTFFAGNFVEALPTGSSRYVSQMYEQARSIEQAWASHQAAIKSGDTELASSIMEEDGDKLKRRFAVNNAKRQISELGQQVKRIESSKLLSADAKRVRLDEIEARRNAIAQRVATVMR
jgi:hypothetical protein